MIEWRAGEPGWNSSTDGSVEDRGRLAVFDTIIGNLDRHTGNYMMDGDKIISIDHGYAFPDTKMTNNRYGTSLQSFILNGAPPPVSDAWQKTMGHTVASVNWSTMLEHTSLTTGERQGVMNRVRLVAETLSAGKGLQPIMKEMMKYGRERGYTSPGSHVSQHSSYGGN